MTPPSIDLSTPLLSFVLQSEGDHLILTQFGPPERPWLAKQSRDLFALAIDGQLYASSALTFRGLREETGAPGMRVVSLAFDGPGFSVEQRVRLYAETALVELQPVVRSRSDQPLALERVDSFVLDIAPGDYDLMYYTGDWGCEFESQLKTLEQAERLESRSGRSSKGQHPWFALLYEGQEVLAGSVVWSGNWVFRFDPAEPGGFRLSGGLNDWEFRKVLAPNEVVQLPAVALAAGTDLNAVSQQFARVGRKHWYPRNDLSVLAPVEWNHWWVYEDVDITEEVFLRNVAAAEPLGIEVCTLDAGWFGPSDPATHWYDYRGDWNLVNTERFPSGIRVLADAVHARGMKFGIWCEIEGLGKQAQLAIDHPDFVARRDGERLGYVCFGNPAAQEWAYQTLARLINDYAADWIKLDFNLDPRAGCSCTDHGHQAGDGLFEHYRGYYRTLERIRADYPQVVLENCSSGGLRIDLGILRQTHMTFLSDPDWPVHDLQIFWGASTMLAPDVLLHWSFCEWRMPEPPPPQTFNPRDPNLTRHQLDYYTRISMLGLYGFSQKLPDLPDWVARRLDEHTRIYKQVVRRFVKTADLYRLTDQPRRSGQGERWSAFQYSLPDASEHLLFVFRLPGAQTGRTLTLRSLQPDRLYTVEGLEGERREQALGSELMTRGLLFRDLPEEGSSLLRIY